MKIILIRQATQSLVIIVQILHQTKLYQEMKQIQIKPQIIHRIIPNQIQHLAPVKLMQMNHLALTHQI